MSLPVQVPSHCVQNKARLCVIVQESESGKCQFFSRVQLFMIPWTVVYQVPYPWESPGKNTGLGCHSHLQEILSTQGLNPGLLPCRQTLYYLSHNANSEFMRSPMLIPPYFSTSSHNILSFTYYSQSYSCAVTPQSITKSIPDSGPLHVLLLLPETFMPALIFFLIFIYLFLFWAALGLHCCLGFLQLWPLSVTLRFAWQASHRSGSSTAEHGLQVWQHQQLWLKGSREWT